MTESEQLIQAREQLKSSVLTALKDFKNYGKVLITQAGTNLSNLKFNDERVMRFKDGVKQKTTSALGKLGKIKNSVIEKLKPSNLDLKIKNLIDQTQIAGLTVANKTKEVYDKSKGYVLDKISLSKNKILKFKDGIKQKTTSTLGKLGKIKNSVIENLRPSNLDLKIKNLIDQTQIAGLTVANKTKEVYDKSKGYVLDKISLSKNKILKFKDGIKQKTTSTLGKLGKIKNSVIENLRPSNLDVKFRNMVDQVQIAGLTVASKVKDAYTSTKEKVTDFATTQIANHYLRQEEREQERVKKEFERAARLAEQEEIQKQRERIRARKKDIIAAFNSQEREKYEQKIEANEARKQELISKLLGEREEPVQESTMAHAR